MPKGHLRTKIIQQLKFGNPTLWAQCKSEDNRGENNKLKTGQWSSESNQSAKRTQMEDARGPGIGATVAQGQTWMFSESQERRRKD